MRLKTARIFTISNIILMLLALVAALIFPLIEATETYADPQINEYSDLSSGAAPSYITKGSDGNLWFTETDVSKIGKISTSGNVTEYTIPTSNSYPAGITSGPNGNLWFAEENKAKIGEVTTSGSFTEYTLPNPSDSAPYGITTGPDGNLWFAQINSGDAIGKISTSGAITEYLVPDGLTVDGSITSGPDGNLWFTLQGGYIGSVTTSGLVTIYSIGIPGSAPTGITSGPDSSLWFSDNGTDSIGKITTSGTVTEYPLPSGNNPLGITTGTDGNLWFTSVVSNSVGSMTPTGSVATYTVPTANSGPTGLTTGPDSNIWFAENTTSDPKIGQVVINPAPAAPTLTAISPTNTAPTLSWNSVTGASTYNVYKNNSEIATTSSTSYVDSAASQGTNSYYVTAVNSGNAESDSSNTVNVAYDSTLPEITNFTANNGTTFSRQNTPYTSGVSTQTVNSDGSVTVSVNSASGYADSGFYLYKGTLGDLPNFTVNSSSGDFGLNLWFDNANLGDFFQWNGSGVLTGLGGDTYGLSSGSTGGTLSVDSSTSFYMMDNGQNYTLSQLIAGDDTTSGINSSTPVTVWIGVDVGSGGSTSATISSVSGL